MKKIIIIGAVIVFICLSFFAGTYFSHKEDMKHREQKSHSFIKFSIDILEELKTEYDTNTMEALISNVYAAVEFTNDGDLYSALHDLWNALIFDGENIVGKEEDLIKALKDDNAQDIKDIAIGIRTIK